MTNPVGRLCDMGARYGADVAIRPTGRGLACDFECQRCGRTLAAPTVTKNGRIMFAYRTRIRTTRNVGLACAIIGRTLRKEHECVTRSLQSHTGQSPSC